MRRLLPARAFLLRRLVERVKELVTLGYGYLQSLVRFLARLAFPDEPPALPVRHNASILAAVPFHHERRLHRALHHLESLKTELRAWSQERPYRMWTDFDVNPGYKLAWVEVFDQPPADLSLIIGDCIHNLRAALDNLAFELALAHNLGEPLPDEVAEYSAFPIFSERKKFVKKRKSLIGCIAPRAQTIIEDLQPYNRGDRFWRDPLWHLYELSNMDKHRLPHVVLFAQTAHAFFVPDNLTVDDIEPIFYSIERRAPIARYPTFDKTGAEVDVQPTPSVNVAFGQHVPPYLRGMPVPIRLSYIRNHVLTKVVRPLHPYLTRMSIAQVSQRYCLLGSKSGVEISSIKVDSPYDVNYD